VFEWGRNSISLTNNLMPFLRKKFSLHGTGLNYVGVKSAFQYCNKITEKINLKEEFILRHSFRGFAPWSLGPLNLCLRQGRMIWHSAHSRAKLLSSWWPEKQRTGWG
jgi:hypothetical protein